MTTGDRSSEVPDGHDVTSGVRHDLRHELATLRTLLDVAVEDGSLDADAVRRVVATAHTEVGVALDLLEALPIPTPRAPLRGEPAHGAVTRRPAAMPSSADLPVCEVDAVLRAAADATTSREHRVAVDAVAPLHVAMRHIELTRVARNLLGNALAATPPGGTVRLIAQQDAPTRGRPRQESATRSYVRLEFHDEGPGPGATGFHRTGGLGLDVVRSLVLPAGGWLVLGRSPFGGACASVILPAPAADA